MDHLKHRKDTGLAFLIRLALINDISLTNIPDEEVESDLTLHFQDIHKEHQVDAHA